MLWVGIRVWKQLLLFNWPLSATYALKKRVFHLTYFLVLTLRTFFCLMLIFIISLQEGLNKFAIFFSASQQVDKFAILWIHMMMQRRERWRKHDHHHHQPTSDILCIMQNWTRLFFCKNSCRLIYSAHDKCV